MKRLPPFDKYDYYFRSVQDPEQTLPFIEKAFRTVHGTAPLSFGEDFCGTFALSCAWVKRGNKRTAVAVDLDPSPILYGMKHYYCALKKDEQSRLSVVESDVRNSRLPQVDVLAAMNFSSFIFKERSEMLRYLKNCRKRVGENGLLVLDCFGGTETTEPNVDEATYRAFTYYWDQVSFDPISHRALFYIHYKRKGERKRERVFRYDWRMWTIPELRELLSEAGFRRSEVWWEGTDRRGRGDGKYRRKEKEENCAAWIAYVTGVP